MRVRDGEFLATDERGVVVLGGVGPQGGTLASVGAGDTVLSLGGFILECEEVTSVEENVLALLLLRGWYSRQVSLWRKKIKQNEKDNIKSTSIKDFCVMPNCPSLTTNLYTSS